MFRETIDLLRKLLHRVACDYIFLFVMLNLGSQPVCRAVQLCVEFSALDEEDMVLKLVSITIYLNIFVARIVWHIPPIQTNRSDALSVR